RWIDQQSLEPVTLGKVRRIVAAERTADQHGTSHLGDGRLKLGNGLARMMMQRRHLQPRAHPDTLQRSRQLARLVRKWRAIEAVQIKNRRRATGHGYSSSKRTKATRRPPAPATRTQSAHRYHRH